jgi:DNA invertase Pin-like site-specific DNA recombinase
LKYGYARVSTDDQITDLQVDALRGTGCTKVFTDHGISGMATDRPELQRLLDTVIAGDCIVVWKMDRLTRSLRHLLELSESLASRGVDLVSLNDPIDTSTIHGKAFFRIMGVLAELERDMIVARTNAGIAAAKARGVHCGRRRALSWEQLGAARRMIAEGKTQRQVARLFRVSDRTLSRRLREAA